MKYAEKKQILFLIMTALCGVAMILFGYFPIAWQKRIVRRTLQQQSLTAEQVRNSVEQSVFLERRIAELEPMARRFEQYVPQTSGFASFWQQIAELMTSHDLQNQQVRPGVESRYDDFNVVSLDIQGSGTLPKIFDFVRSLEQMDRLVRIEQMELTNDKDMTGQLTFSAKAQVFYRTPTNNKAG
jgi:Tfp pilus assembly protein PilO